MEHDQIEEIVNHVNDMDREWWPFVFLRPEPHERMTTRRVAVIAALYGVLAGLFVNVVLVLSGRSAGSFNPLIFPLGTTLGFFVVYRFTFAYFWNRRAERLARPGRKWSDQLSDR